MSRDDICAADGAMEPFPYDPLTPAEATDESQRNEARDSLFLMAELRGPGQPVLPVRVRNLSAGGLMAEYTGLLDSGSVVELDVRGVGWVPGRIAWRAAGRIGVAFDRPIDPLSARKPVGNGKRP